MADIVHASTVVWGNGREIALYRARVATASQLMPRPMLLLHSSAGLGAGSMVCATKWVVTDYPAAAYPFVRVRAA